MVLIWKTFAEGGVRAGVVDEDVESAELFNGLGAGHLRCLWVGYVRGDSQYAAGIGVELLRFGLQLFGGGGDCF